MAVTAPWEERRGGVQFLTVPVCWPTLNISSFGIIFTAHPCDVHTGHGAYPASCKMGTGSFPGVKRPGRGAAKNLAAVPTPAAATPHTAPTPSLPPTRMRSLDPPSRMEYYTDRSIPAHLPDILFKIIKKFAQFHRCFKYDY
jgi:hypothetical protein